MSLPLIQVVPWRWTRRIVQLAFLALFLYFFRATEGTGDNNIPKWVSLYFQVDPLVGACAMIAGRTFLWVFIPAIILLLLTLLTGRFFCGWICPLGTMLDVIHRVVRSVTKKVQQKIKFDFQRLRHARHFLLLVILLSAIVGVQIVGYFDPFSILTRTFAVGLDSALYHSVTNGSAFLYQQAPTWITAVSEPVYAFFKEHVLSLNEPRFVYGSISVVILFSIFALEFLERRFWCRYICPLGSMLGLTAHFSPFRRSPARSCGNCRACEKDCRMGAFDSEHRYSPEICTLCLDCVENCPREMVSFTIKPQAALDKPTDLSKRTFLSALALGVALPVTARAVGITKTSGQSLRPPGADEEGDFLDLCIRCGECLKVCPTNALQTTLLEDGAEAIFAPRLIPRIGYCEYNCNLCGQVCPTGAIPNLTVNEKQHTRIGKAHFDESRCIPYARHESCMVCEEHCPVPEKAIQYTTREVTDASGNKISIDMPYIVHKLCIGCGICENKCPLDGEAAIRVSRGHRRGKEESKHKKEKHERGEH